MFKKLNNLRVLFLVLFVLFMLIGCGSDDKSTGSTEASSDTVTDIDGNVYQAVTIGTQVWMAENLKVTHYRNGDAIPIVADSATWADLATGAYCEYDNDINNVATYGRLYNWFAVRDTRRLEPDGWHVPSNAEWQTLIAYLGGVVVAGGEMKDIGTDDWNSPNTGATNESGFTGLPGGGRHVDVGYVGLGYGAIFWSSTETVSGYANYQGLYHDNPYSYDGEYIAIRGFSIRLIKD